MSEAAQENITIYPAPAGQVPADAPVPEAWQRITTRTQAAARRNESFRALTCMAWAPELEWFSRDGGYGLRRDRAHFMSVADAIRATQGWEGVLFYIGTAPSIIQPLPATTPPAPNYINEDPSDRPWTIGAGGLPIPNYENAELDTILHGPNVEMGTIGVSTRQIRLISQHVPNARELPCLIWSPQDGWWRARGAGCSPEKSQGVTRRLVDAATSMTAGDIAHIMMTSLGNSQPEQGPPKPVRTPIVQLVPAPIIKLLTAYPQNKTFRAQLMAVLGEMVPDEMTTWEGIKEWVEMNFPKKKDLLIPKRAIQNTISIRMSRRYTERGRCEYVRTMYGSRTCMLENSELLTIINESMDEEGNIEDVIGSVVGRMEGQIQCEQDGPLVEINDCEPNEEDGINNECTNFSRTDLKNLIYAFIRDNCPPETQDYFDL